MNLLEWIMLGGILFSFTKILIFSVWIWWLENKSKYIIKKWNDDWTQKIAKNLFISFISEILIAIVTGWGMNEIHKFSDEIYDLIFKILTSIFSLSFISIYGYSIAKTLIKISARINS